MPDSHVYMPISHMLHSRLNKFDKFCIAESVQLGAIRDLALVLAKENIDDDDVLVIGGDNLNGKYESNRYGVVKLDENKKIIEFCEKPSNSNGTNHNGSPLVSMCLYFFSKEKISLIQEYLKV